MSPPLVRSSAMCIVSLASRSLILSARHEVILGLMWRTCIALELGYFGHHTLSVLLRLCDPGCVSLALTFPGSFNPLETCRTRPSSVSHLGPLRAWVLATGTLKTARLVGFKPKQARWLDVTSARPHCKSFFRVSFRSRLLEYILEIIVGCLCVFVGGL